MPVRMPAPKGMKVSSGRLMMARTFTCRASHALTYCRLRLATTPSGSTIPIRPPGRRNWTQELDAPFRSRHFQRDILFPPCQFKGPGSSDAVGCAPGSKRRMGENQIKTFRSDAGMIVKCQQRISAPGTARQVAVQPHIGQCNTHHAV